MSPFSFFCFGLFALVFGQEEGPVVTIPDGKLKGTVNQTIGKNIPYYAFRGIPFAKKPVGNLRFAPPVKNDPWSGVLDATHDKDWCTQKSQNIVGGTVVGSEDCLYINVYSTNLNASLPVMVWIYGGGFTSGASSYELYAPDYLIEENVIFVAFNYRLGVFGFLSTEDAAATGNWGLKDQVLALKWVKDNIQYFGGDSNKITIFGQSAGSASVSYLVQSELTQGLYNRAIMHSGTTLCLWTLTRNARNKAFNVGARLGIFTLNSQTLINHLRQVDYKQLKEAEANVTTMSLLTESLVAGLPFGVVEEPDLSGAIFSKRSYELLLNGQFNRVPTIIGYTSNEGGALQAYVNLLRPAFFQYELDVTRLVPYDLTRNFFKRLAAGFNIKNHYFGAGSISSQPAAVTKFFTVDQFNRPIRETVNLMSAYKDVYFYKFSYKGLFGASLGNYTGVGHAEELNYLFVNQNRLSSAQDKAIREKFVTLWTNFAKNGNPTMSDGGTILRGISWIPNSPGDNTNVTIRYLNINNTLTMETNPDQEDWEYYQDVYKRWGDPPYATY